MLPHLKRFQIVHTNDTYNYQRRIDEVSVMIFKELLLLSIVFLAVHDSSIGDLVTLSVIKSVKSVDL